MSRTAHRSIASLFCVAAMAVAHAAPGELVKDINPAVPAGNPSADIDAPLVVGPVAYFRASDPLHGSELWRSDGTAAGTVLFADLEPGPFGAQPNHLLVLPNGTLLVESLTSTTSLYRTDGTPSGTFPLPAAIGYIDSGSVSPSMKGSPFALFQGECWFIGNTPATSSELFKTDGTVAGTTLAIETIAGTNSLVPQYPIAAGASLYYRTVASGLRKLWATDGTPAGTHVIYSDPSSGSFPQSLTVMAAFNVLGGLLLFDARGAGGALELWRSDGTPAGTFMLAPVRPLWFVFSGGKAFFAGLDASGGNPWVTDGTPAGTHRIVEMMAAPAFGVGYEAGVPLNGGVVFTGNDGVHGNEPWFTDGTAAGTHSIADLAPGSSSSSPFGYVADGSRVLFDANAPGSKLYETDGQSVKLVADVQPASVFASPKIIGSVNGTILFGANDGVHGNELWATPGSPTPPMLLEEIATPEGSISSMSDSAPPPPMVKAGAFGYFAADDGTAGNELWRSDGTPAGTSLVADVKSGTPSSNPTPIAALDARMLFTADDGISGVEPWITDGTASGTLRLADIAPGMASSAVTSAIRVGPALLFAADDGAHGSELWRTDGTPAGTALLADIEPSLGSSAPQLLRIFDGRLYFAATRGDVGRELFVTDGTAAGTVLFKDIQPGAVGSSPSDAEDMGSRLFFLAATIASGREPWSTDGTAAGTTMIKDIRPGATSSINLKTLGSFMPNQLTAGLEGKVVFIADDGIHGPDVWLTDGTAAGTWFVADFAIQFSLSVDIAELVFPRLVAGPTRAYVLALTNKYPGVFNSTVRIYSLFATDGTPGSKTLVVPSTWDLPGIGPPISDVRTAPMWMPGEDDHLLFRWNDGLSGQELFSTDGSGAAPVQVTDSAQAQASANPSQGVRIGNRLLFGATDGITGFEPHVAPFTNAYAMEPYGAGCGGPTAPGPTLRGVSAPVAGGLFGLELKHAPAGQSAVFLASFTQGFAPLGNGCTLLLGGNVHFLAQTATDSQGQVTLEAPLPNDPVLNGLVVRFQCATGVVYVTALSDGLEVVFQG